MQKAKIILFLFLFSLFFPTTTIATETCQPIYGGGKNCLPQDKIGVDTKVQAPRTKNFVDNLSLSDPKFHAGDAVNIQLSITNRSKKTLPEIEILDNLPNFITYTSGAGSYDPKTRILVFKLSNLGQNETRKFMVVGEISEISESTCVVNYVVVKSGDITSDDNSKFCLEKNSGQTTTKGGQNVMSAPKGMSKSPATGPEMLPLISLIPFILVGIYLRNKSKLRSSE